MLWVTKMKRKMLLLTILGLVLSLLPSIVFALDLSWQNSPNDKSIFYLGQIFGPVGSALPNGTGNALISQLFSIFNIAVLTLGSIVVSYTIILSTINTAQEGEVMGKKFSSLWIPLRSAVGMAFLIPTAGGYSLLQMMMMNIVVYGIASANQIWAQVVYAFSGSGTGLTGVVQMDQSALQSVASSILKSAICTNVINTNSACSGVGTVMAYTKPNDNANLYFGVMGNNSYSNVCGQASASTSIPSQAQDATSWNASNQMAFSLTYSNYATAAAEVASNNLPTATNIIFTGMNVLQGNISSTPQVQNTNLASANQQALDNGWLFAGSYYFVMISNGNNNLNWTGNSPTASPNGVPDSTQSTNLSGACNSAISAAVGPALTTYLSYSDPAGQGTGSSTSMVMPSVPVPSSFQGVMNAIDAPLNDFMNTFMLKLTTNDPRGPVASLADIGSLILNLAQIIWFSVMLAAIIALVLACIMSGMQPACWVISAAITVLMPILTAVIMLLWGIGAMIGIYLPMVPYLVFTFTALGWMLLVIETIVAAPIVALGLVSPAGEHLGKAAPAVLLVVNVFLRPSLMVIGFAIAAKLVDAMIAMLNYGYFATLSSNTQSTGLFGSLATLGLYGGVAIAIIHECFSLIHVLPDKIIRWIGGQAEQSNVKQLVAEAKKGAEKGAEVGAGIMKGASGALEKAAEEYKKKSGGEEEG